MISERSEARGPVLVDFVYSVFPVCHWSDAAAYHYGDIWAKSQFVPTDDAGLRSAESTSTSSESGSHCSIHVSIT
jgi:hypothetical protein